MWGEATAVVEDGRANPNQLVINPETVESIASLRLAATAERANGFEGPDLVVGMQLTHSGRWSRPHGEPIPRIAQRIPALDARVPVIDTSVMSDDELDDLALRYIEAGELAADAGFDFVDIKHCHGYLLHEILTARSRPGRFGGTFEGRTRFLRLVAEELRRRRPELKVAVRLSAYDPGPYTADEDGIGRPETGGFVPFGPDDGGNPFGETHRFLRLCAELGVGLVSITIGSPYYNPHAQRPAYHPALDGYLPPREPLAEVARHLTTTAALAKEHPDLVLVGSGYSYLQEFLANAGQYQIRTGGVGMVGVGRLALSYPGYPADILAGRALNPRLICRTFSDCTTAPRIGQPSGCYPLDEHYKKSAVRVEIAAAKKRKRAAGE
jgi:2,4-dienoyl-CoA reductase-like NADH-dependent reductase (Old Yellow Enzyme family)